MWLLKGKQEKNLVAMKTSLDYSQSALDAAPEQNHYRFNIAFVQIQTAQLVYSLPEASRTLADLEASSTGLDEAIESLQEIANSPNPPFPKHDIEQRANMGRNTIRKQLERAVQSQREYETKNADRLEKARQVRDAEIRKREDEKKAAQDKIEEQRRKLREERERIAEEDRRLVQQRLEEERMRADADMTTDEETGERRKREKKKATKRKKKGEESDTDPDASDAEVGGHKSRGRTTSATPATGDDAEERPKKKKRRKLERKGKAVNSKFKSDEKIVDSDSDEEAVQIQEENTGLAAKFRDAEEDGDENMANGDDGEEAVAQPRRKKPARVVDEDDDEDEEPADVSMVDETAPAAGNEDALDS